MSTDDEISCYVIEAPFEIEDKIWYSSVVDFISVQSGDRVSQMTKTYNDIDAVTRLLEEKEKDLELAARIGQKLLQKCQTLEQRNDVLEEETLNNRDQITQLKHELSTKTDLLRIYQNNELDGAESEAGEDIPFIHLQRKIQELEVENFDLIEKTKHISLETENLEGQELQLIQDFKERLGELDIDSKRLSDELYNKIEECNRQQEDLTHLLAQVADLQSRNKTLKLENEELHNHLQAAKECQNDLTTELVDFKEKYEEIVELLHDAQQQLRSVRQKSLPTIGRSGMFSPYVNFDSLASELESSISGESGNFNMNTRQLHNLKVFETVRYAKQRNNAEDNLSLLPHLYTGPTVHQSALAKGSICSVVPMKTSSRNERNHPPNRLNKSSRNHMTPLDSAVASDSEGSGNEDLSYLSFNSLGRPGVPGSDDLETALQRLSLRRQSESEYLHSRMNIFHEESIHTPAPCRTPDSIMSTGSGYSAFSGLTSASGYAIRHYHIPEKLQIVKPMEGSATLHQWQQLATPHLGGIFEERPGVQIKGERKLEEIGETCGYDIEEDDDDLHPGKHFDSSAPIYTYTDSKVLHPDDSTNVTPSGVQNTSISSTTWLVSQQSRERTTSTFSTTMSLAKFLQERDIQGKNAVISGDGTKEEQNVPNVLINADPFPATPCNSPTHSPPGSPFFSPLKMPGLATLTTYLSRGAELLGVGSTDHLKYATKSAERDRPKDVGMSSSVSYGNINILGKLSEFGLDNVVQLQQQPQQQKSVHLSYLPLGAYPHAKASPMTQLTSLRSLTIPRTSSQTDMAGSATATTTTEKQPLMSSTPHLKDGSSAADVYHELGNIGSLSSFRKGGFS